MQIRARTQALAIVEYERALKLNGDAPCFEKASAKAWALHRIAVLGVAIATHHEERQASYKKFGRSYPEAARITEFRTKVHGAATRLKREFPEAELEPGKPLWEVSALPTKKNAPPSPRRR